MDVERFGKVYESRNAKRVREFVASNEKILRLRCSVAKSTHLNKFLC